MVRVWGVTSVQVRKILLGFWLFCVPLVVSGCGLLSANGPVSQDIWGTTGEKATVPYVLVPVTPKITAFLATNAPRLTAFADRSQRRPRDIRFGIGDIVSITIFEAAAGGLFIPAQAGVRPGNFITIPNQAVDVNGNISVPYAGSIRARGRTQVELQQAIVGSLENRALEPQVIVSLVDQKTSLVTVITEGRASRVPALLSPERLLETIARAGGQGGAGSDMWVILERNGRRGIAPFGALVYETVNNVYTHPNDTIYLYREPQTFLAFGALGNQQQIPFGAWRLSLAEAISKAGGLSDAQADPAAVFLYRGESRDVAEAMGIDCRPFEGPMIPVIYRINLRDPSGYFLATTFEMRNKDVIYVANSFSVETTKFLTLLGSVNSAIQGGLSTATSAYGLRNLIRGNGQVPVVIQNGGGGAIP
jgi:polysaccharide biosynthesis/export protein